MSWQTQHHSKQTVLALWINTVLIPLNMETREKRSMCKIFLGQTKERGTVKYMIYGSSNFLDSTLRLLVKGSKKEENVENSSRTNRREERVTGKFMTCRGLEVEVEKNYNQSRKWTCEIIRDSERFMGSFNVSADVRPASTLFPRLSLRRFFYKQRRWPQPLQFSLFTFFPPCCPINHTKIF